jgi:alanine dehydrogenase
MALYLSNADVRRALDMPTCVAEFEAAVLELAAGRAANAPRSHGYLPGPTAGSVFRLKLFHGGVTARGVYALRVLTDFLAPETVAGVERQAEDRRFNKLFVFSLATGDLLGIVEDDYLQRLRVGAESATIARHLTRPDATTVGLLGSGRQAATQLLGLCAVRPIQAVRVYSPTAAHREAFAAQMTAALGLPVTPVDDAQAAVRGADIVVAATNTSEPVLHGAWLEPGMHVISLVNSDKHLPRREVDDALMARCTPIVISTREQVENDEPADIYEPLRRRLIGWDKLVPMADLAAGRHPGRTSREQITLHKNNGLSIQFAVAAAAALERAHVQGLGLEVPAAIFGSGREAALV